MIQFVRAVEFYGYELNRYFSQLESDGKVNDYANEFVANSPVGIIGPYIFSYGDGKRAWKSVDILP